MSGLYEAFSAASPGIRRKRLNPLCATPSSKPMALQEFEIPAPGPGAKCRGQPWSRIRVVQWIENWALQLACALGEGNPQGTRIFHGWAGELMTEEEKRLADRVSILRRLLPPFVCAIYNGQALDWDREKVLSMLTNQDNLNPLPACRIFQPGKNQGGFLSLRRGYRTARHLGQKRAALSCRLCRPPPAPREVRGRRFRIFSGTSRGIENTARQSLLRCLCFREPSRWALPWFCLRRAGESRLQYRYDLPGFVIPGWLGPLTSFMRFALFSGYKNSRSGRGTAVLAQGSSAAQRPVRAGCIGRLSQDPFAELLDHGFASGRRRGHEQIPGGAHRPTGRKAAPGSPVQAPAQSLRRGPWPPPCPRRRPGPACCRGESPRPATDPAAACPDGRTSMTSQQPIRCRTTAARQADRLVSQAVLAPPREPGCKPEPGALRAVSQPAAAPGPHGIGQPDVQTPPDQVDLAVVGFQLDGDIRVDRLEIGEPRYQPLLGQGLNRDDRKTIGLGTAALAFADVVQFGEDTLDACRYSWPSWLSSTPREWRTNRGPPKYASSVLIR